MKLILIYLTNNGRRLGGSITAVLRGIKPPDAIKLPVQPQIPGNYTPITGY